MTPSINSANADDSKLCWNLHNIRQHNSLQLAIIEKLLQAKLH
jgi:hypothetical protein